MAYLTFYLPKKLLEEIDQKKGPYLSRNKFVLKSVHEAINRTTIITEERKAALQGSEGTNHGGPATTATPVLSDLAIPLQPLLLGKEDDDASDD